MSFDSKISMITARGTQTIRDCKKWIIDRWIRIRNNQILTCFKTWCKAILIYKKDRRKALEMIITA